ncbi:hypothetical protein PG994_000162 [Apiospora phragmitis]|uniref:Glycine zipper 2TM domain-containing protein n=1 Tax=Apiospora phragmitis TaxID=2905665 RepID=A0ABR1X5H2_9PEZI
MTRKVPLCSACLCACDICLLIQSTTNGGGGGGSGGAYPPRQQYPPQSQYGQSPSPYPPQQQYTQSSSHLSPYPSHPEYARPGSAHSNVGFSSGPPPPRYEEQGGHLAPCHAPQRPHSADPYSGGHYAGGDEKRGRSDYPNAAPGAEGEDGERGLGASLIGGGAGGFLGHKLGKGKLGTFLGGAAGAVAANVLESKFKDRRNSHSSSSSHGHGHGHGHHGGGGHSPYGYGGGGSGEDSWVVRAVSWAATRGTTAVAVRNTAARIMVAIMGVIMGVTTEVMDTMATTATILITATTATTATTAVMVVGKELISILYVPILLQVKFNWFNRRSGTCGYEDLGRLGHNS